MGLEGGVLSLDGGLQDLSRFAFCFLQDGNDLKSLERLE